MHDTPHLRLRSTALPMQDGDLLAAIDLGSNSFHMVVSRYVLGQLRTVDRLRDQLGDEDGEIRAQREKDGPERVGVAGHGRSCRRVAN